MSQSRHLIFSMMPPVSVSLRPLSYMSKLWKPAFKKMEFPKDGLVAEFQDLIPPILRHCPKCGTRMVVVKTDVELIRGCVMLVQKCEPCKENYEILAETSCLLPISLN